MYGLSHTSFIILDSFRMRQVFLPSFPSAPSASSGGSLHSSPSLTLQTLLPSARPQERSPSSSAEYQNQNHNCHNDYSRCRYDHDPLSSLEYIFDGVQNRCCSLLFFFLPGHGFLIDIRFCFADSLSFIRQIQHGLSIFFSGLKLQVFLGSVSRKTYINRFCLRDSCICFFPGLLQNTAFYLLPGEILKRVIQNTSCIIINVLASCLHLHADKVHFSVVRKSNQRISGLISISCFSSDTVLIIMIVPADQHLMPLLECPGLCLQIGRANRMLICLHDFHELRMRKQL